MPTDSGSPETDTSRFTLDGSAASTEFAGWLAMVTLKSPVLACAATAVETTSAPAAAIKAPVRSERTLSSIVLCPGPPGDGLAEINGDDHVVRSITGPQVIGADCDSALDAAAVDVTDLRRDGDGDPETSVLLERGDQASCVGRWLIGDPRGGAAGTLHIDTTTAGRRLLALLRLHAQAHIYPHSGIEGAPAHDDALLARVQILGLRHDHPLAVVAGLRFPRGVRVRSRGDQGQCEECRNQCRDQKPKR